MYVHFLLANFDPLCRFLYIFCGQPVVAVIMIDGSETCKSLAGVEVQCLYVIERLSKGVFLNLLV